jgi:hypothetical protein
MITQSWVKTLKLLYEGSLFHAEFMLHQQKHPGEKHYDLSLSRTFLLYYRVLLGEKLEKVEEAYRGGEY